MRISLVLLFCFLVAVINANAAKPTTRRVPANGGSGVTKAPIRKYAYDYLRSVRGKKSCASGTCPFWERHGRSFAALRCYAQEYKECVCLHRMCFSSCMFKREVCNEEMVSCLQQICRRCMSVAEQAVCKAYDSMAVRVAESLSNFACYPCCPTNQNSSNTATNRPNTNTVTTNQASQNNAPKPNNANTGAPSANGANGVNAARPPNGVNGVNAARPPNGVNGVNAARPPNGANGVNAARPPNGANGVNAARPPNGANGMNAARPPNGVNAARPPNGVNAGRPANGANAMNAARPANGVNAARPANGVNAARPPNGVNGVRPANAALGGNGGANQQVVLNQAVNNGNPPRPNGLPNTAGNSINGGNQSPKVPPMVRQKIRRVSTTRRTGTVRNSNIKNNPRTTVPIQKKPQTPNNRIKN